MNRILAQIHGVYCKAYSISRFGTHVAMTMTANILHGLLGVVTGALVARLLLPEGRGELAAIQSWSAFIATIASLGLPEAVVYFSGREAERARRYWVSAIALALVIGVPFMIVGYWLMPWLLWAQSTEVVSTACLYLLGLIPLFALHWMPSAAVRGRSDFVVWNVLQFLPTIGWLFILLLAASMGYRTPSFVALGYLAMLAILFLPVVWIVSRRVPGLLSVDMRCWGSMLRYALPLGVATVPQQLLAYGRLAQMMMAAIVDPRSLGLFAVAVAWGNVTGPLSHAVGVVLFPDVASRSTSDEKGKVLARGVRFSVLLTVSLSSVLLILTPHGVPALFGEDFSPAVPAAMVMVAAGGIMGIKMILDQGLRGWGKSGTVLVAELIGLVVMGALLPQCLSSFSIMGASIATLIGYASTTLYLILQTHRETRIPIGRLLYPNTSEVLALRARFHALRHNLIVGHREGR